MAMDEYRSGGIDNPGGDFSDIDSGQPNRQPPFDRSNDMELKETAADYNQNDKYGMIHEKTKEKSKPKILFGGLLLCVLIAGIILAIVLLIQPYEEKPKPFYGCRHNGTDILKFHGNMTIYCQFHLGNVSKEDDSLEIKFDSSEPLSKEHEYNVTIKMEKLNEVMSVSGDWEASMEKTNDSESNDLVWAFVLTRKRLNCDSGGVYKFAVVHDNKQKIKYEVSVEMSNEASPVEMSIVWDNKTSEFQIQCSVDSGCSSQSIYLEGTTENGTFVINDVTFVCGFIFDLLGGATTRCTGTASSQVLNYFDSIICRPGDLIGGRSFAITNKEGEIFSSVLCMSGNCNSKCSANKKTKYMDDTSCSVYHVCNDDDAFTTVACDNGMMFSNSTCECSSGSDLVTGCDNGKWKVPLADLTECKL